MRASPHIWKSFWSLKRGDNFYIGKRFFVKFNSYVADYVGRGGSRYVAPWRRVRTTELVKAKHPIKGRVVSNRITATECRESMASQPPPGYPWGGMGQPTSFTGCAHAPAVSERQQLENLDRILAEANVRDPMNQDHTPDNPRTHDRTL